MAQPTPAQVREFIETIASMVPDPRVRPVVLNFDDPHEAYELALRSGVSYNDMIGAFDEFNIPKLSPAPDIADLTPEEYAEQQIESRTAADEVAEARGYLKSEAIAIATQRTDMLYNEADDTFWWQAVPNTDVWRQVDGETLAQLPADAQPITFKDDDDRDIIRTYDADAGITTPDVPRTEPFIGGIPADYQSNRTAIGSEQFESEINKLTQLGIDQFEAYIQPGVDRNDGIVSPGAAPVHEEGDQWLLFAGKDEVTTARWQRALVEAGYLSKADLATHEGFWQQADAGAMRNALIDANYNGMGTDITRWLEWMKTSRENMTDEEKAAAAGIQPFVAPVYKKPDYATAAQTARTALASALGRMPEAWELKMLAQEFTGDFRSQYNAEVAGARSEYDASVRAILEGESQSAGAVQDVDPFARMQERIFTRYEDEIDRNELVSATRTNTSHLMNVLAGIEGGI